MTWPHICCSWKIFYIFYFRSNLILGLWVKIGYGSLGEVFSAGELGPCTFLPFQFKYIKIKVVSACCTSRAKCVFWFLDIEICEIQYSNILSLCLRSTRYWISWLNSNVLFVVLPVYILGMVTFLYSEWFLWQVLILHKWLVWYHSK